MLEKKILRTNFTFSINSNGNDKHIHQRDVIGCPAYNEQLKFRGLFICILGTKRLHTRKCVYRYNQKIWYKWTHINYAF